MADNPISPSDIFSSLKSFFHHNRFPILVFLIWRLCILTHQVFLEPNFKQTEYSETLTHRLYDSWNTYWDAGHYIAIAEHGYTYPLQNFFPLWPLSIRITSYLIGTVPQASYILTILLSFTTTILFYNLAKKLLTEQQAQAALLLFISYPAALFLHAGYTETLFFVLILSTFLLIEQKKYLLAALVGGLTSATRLVGIILPLIFTLIPVPWKKKIPLLPITLIGIVGYCTFLFITTHNPFYFSEAQKEWCKINHNCTLTMPWTTLYQKFQELPSLHEITLHGIGYDTLNWYFSVLFILASVFMIRTLPYRYTIYSWATILFPLATGSTASMTRYVYIAFPVFFILGKYLSNKYLLALLIIIFSLIQLYSINNFTNFIWVAFNQLLQNQV